MRVTTISASVRYSKALGNGTHKTVELSAEASLDTKDTWRQAQAGLYADLGQQLRTLWATKTNGNGQPPAGNDKTEAAPNHHCQEHDVPFQRYEKQGKVWYSHRITGSDDWCREKP